MQLLRGLEQWGRKRALGALARGMRTHEISAGEVGKFLEQQPSAKLLLIGISQRMGQFLCATPLIRAFAVAWPRAALHFLSNPVNATAARANPHLHRVWVWKKSALLGWPAQIRDLRKERFDLALLLTTARPSATGIYLARATAAHWVAGYVPSVPGAAAEDALALCHIRIPFEGEKNEVEKFLGFARAFGVPAQGRQPEFVPTRADHAAADAFLAGQNLPATGPRVGLFIGGKAQRSGRLWPVSHFARLADALKAAGCQVIALSPPAPTRASSSTFDSKEHMRLEEFRRALAWTCPMYQEASLGRVAALIQRLDLLVCPDGGILHVAAAVGTPTLGLFFTTDPAVWRHALRQTFLDGRGKPSSELRPETVAHEVFRFLEVSARP